MSGSQLVLQLHVILCTGQVLPISILSITVSFINLSLAACRAFFMLRDPRHSDPDPSLHMLLSVLPWILLSLSFSIINWTLVFGVLKAYGGFFIVVMFVSNYAALWKILKDPSKIKNKENFNLDEENEEKSPAIQNNTFLSNNQCEKKSFYKLQTAVAALWVPCMVGKTYHLFIAVSISSLLCRSVAFVTASCLGMFKSAPVPDGSFLIYCHQAYNNTLTRCEDFSTDCFNMSSSGQITQKFRICQNEELDWTFLCFVLAVFVSCLLSILVLWRLNWLSNYENFLKTRDTVFAHNYMIFIQKPVVHISLLFDIIEDKDLSDEQASDKLETILLRTSDRVKMLNRPFDGELLIIHAVKQKRPKCIKTLLSNNALIIENANAQYPLNVAVQYKNVEITKILLERGAEKREDSSGNPLTAAIRQANVEMVDIMMKDNDNNAAVRRAMKAESSFGVIHTEQNSPLLLSVLASQTWSLEQKTNLIKNSCKIFEEDNLTDQLIEEAERILSEWNREHPEQQLKVGDRKLYKDEDEKTVEVRTCDRDVGSSGQITKLTLELRGPPGASIASLQAEYGAGVAGARHRTGRVYSGQQVNWEVIKIQGRIRRITTDHHYDDGSLIAIEVCYL